jgi:hypothetical protein
VPDAIPKLYSTWADSGEAHCAARGSDATCPAFTALYEHLDPREGFHRDWNTFIYNFGRSEVQGFLIASALGSGGSASSSTISNGGVSLASMSRTLPGSIGGTSMCSR